MTLRAGLIGLGMMGRHHARVLGSLEGVELVAVADPGGDPHGIAGGRPVLSSVEELIAVGLDYCMVAVPTAFHEEVGVALAAAGVHAMVEKPLAADTASARRLATAFESAGLVGAVGHIERYNPALQEARRRLAGVVKDLGTHDIDLTAWVTGQTYVSVSAQVAHRSGREHEDLVAIVGLLSDGTVTNHLVNWLSPLKERVTIITGERGTFVADTLTADLTYFANGTVTTEKWNAIADFRGVSEGDVVRYAISKPEPLRTEHEAFRDAVLGKESDIVTMEQGLATVAVAEAALLSAATGTTQVLGTPVSA